MLSNSDATVQFWTELKHILKRRRDVMSPAVFILASIKRCADEQGIGSICSFFVATNAILMAINHKSLIRDKQSFWLANAALYLAGIAITISLGAVRPLMLCVLLVAASIATWFICLPIVIHSTWLARAARPTTAYDVLLWWTEYFVTFSSVAITLFGTPLAFKYGAIRTTIFEIIAFSWTLTVAVHCWQTLRRKFTM